MKQGHAEIDGCQVDLRKGETILSAAKRAEIDIPTLCYVEGCEPEGGCRMCLVQLKGQETLQAACHTPIEAGMEITTTSPELSACRQGIAQLIQGAHPETARAARTTEFGQLLGRIGMSPQVPATRTTSSAVVEQSHPYLRFDPRLCITCRRCVHVCEEVQGQFVFHVSGRGSGSRLVLGSSESFLESDCTSCGACVDLCPTEAIWDVDRAGDGCASHVTESTCAYCGVGCRIRVESDKGRVLSIAGIEAAPVNRGHLCSKGRYAHGYLQSSDRLTHPLLREGEHWREIAWDEALSLAAERMLTIRREHGSQALGVVTSSHSTNEAAYLFQKLFRVGIGTNNVDCCARGCHSSTAVGLHTVTGTSAASASYEDIERAHCIVLAGANPTEAHPVVGARIKRAVLAGAKLIVVDPRRIELAEYADVHLGLRPGTNVALFNALAAVLLEQELVDREFLEQRTEGLAEFESFQRVRGLAQHARDCRVDLQYIRAAAQLLGQSGPTLFVSGVGLSELAQGSESVMAFCNLALLTGNIGRPGAGLLPLWGQINGQGNADMGALPDLITGYQALDGDQVRTRVQELWGTPVPTSPGLTLPGMLDSARRREMRALWVQGGDLVQSSPHESQVIEALESLEFLVVQELFPSRTSRYAHLLLPAAAALEQEGTFTNAERRIQRVRAAVAAPGEARPDWEVARDLARAMGHDWDYEHPRQVMSEVARVAPHLFGGVSYERLEPDGLQWPCPDREHPGTACLHADGFARGRGKLMTIEYAPSPEHDVEGYPYLLNTGRLLQQYNVGSMTRRTPQCDFVDRDVLEIHPQDAKREGVLDGAEVELESRWGTARMQAAVSNRVQCGELFLSFHFPETHANRLTGPHLDSLSACPQYKVTAVRICR